MQANYLIENIMNQPHPSILHFVECFIDSEERLCVVMEHCDVETLDWLIRKREHDWFSEEDVRNIDVNVI